MKITTDSGVLIYDQSANRWIAASGSWPWLKLVLIHEIWKSLLQLSVHESDSPAIVAADLAQRLNGQLSDTESTLPVDPHAGE
jgi:hypothetical protein